MVKIRLSFDRLNIENNHNRLTSETTLPQTTCDFAATIVNAKTA
jgi:hypothetical protein